MRRAFVLLVLLVTACEGSFIRPEDLGRKVSDFTYAIQGFGNVGSWAARLLHAEGGKIVAVSDVSGAIRNPAGIDIPALYEYALASKKIVGFPGADAMPTSALLAEPCDVFVEFTKPGSAKANWVA